MLRIPKVKRKQFQNGLAKQPRGLEMEMRSHPVNKTGTEADASRIAWQQEAKCSNPLPLLGLRLGNGGSSGAGKGPRIAGWRVVKQNGTGIALLQITTVDSESAGYEYKETSTAKDGQELREQ